jgi:hypothetical protein
LQPRSSARTRSTASDSESPSTITGTSPWRARQSSSTALSRSSTRSGRAAPSTTSNRRCADALEERLGVAQQKCGGHAAERTAVMRGPSQMSFRAKP